jgi:hypothetical protein
MMAIGQHTHTKDLPVSATSGGGTIPVAMFVFNRPEKAFRCLSSVRSYRPRRLYIFGDGPRRNVPQDGPLCERSQSICAAVDWPCEIITDFAHDNLGIMERVTSGINKVFQSEEHAVFLEDDCVVDPSFFGFADTLLHRYKDDPRVMCINAPNYQNGMRRGEGDYFFTKYALTWGWATWRRAWSRFEPDLWSWEKFRRDRLWRVFRSIEERLYWAAVYERERANVGTRAANWDYAWLLSCWVHDGLCICPQVNLVQNIGDGPDATHTTSSLDWLPAVGQVTGTISPADVRIDELADHATFRNLYGRRAGPFAGLRRYAGLTRGMLRALCTRHGREVLRVPSCGA